MRTFIGIANGSSIAIGPARLLPPRIDIAERRVANANIAAELTRFDDALQTTDARMEQISRDTRAPSDIGVELVDTHRAILQSDELGPEAKRIIRDRNVGAEWAVRLVVEEMRSVFAGMEDERFRARFEDVDAVAARLLRTLLALPEVCMDERLKGAIAVGTELSPLDALELHRFGIAGFATERGGPTSHGAIVARGLDLPFVFGVRGLLTGLHPGEIACVDGSAGEVVLSPDPPTLEVYRERERLEAKRWTAFEVVGQQPAVTLDGAAIAMGANIETADEIPMAIAGGADHIGLVRTELLYLERRTLPTEEEQHRDAVTILQAAAGRPVTFRTLDVGGDKLPLGIPITVGPNPALGLRGIRLSLSQPAAFRTQLRALFRAGAEGPVRIMFPLVSSVSEIHDARALCAEVCAELAAEGRRYDPRVPLGAMIETPSAVLTADHIAAACDFLSVGTNDLIQYAFAADRQNEDMTYLYQPLHPAILRSLERVFAAAQARSIPVSVCGDMAGDPMCTWILLGLGLRSFSMTARSLPVVRSVVRKTELAQTVALRAEVEPFLAHAQVEGLVRQRMGTRFALELGRYSA